VVTWVHLWLRVADMSTYELIKFQNAEELAQAVPQSG
jgi:hypothetical protein